MSQTPAPLIDRLGDMDFAKRLVTARHDKGMTQQALADQSASTSPKSAATKRAPANPPWTSYAPSPSRSR